MLRGTGTCLIWSGFTILTDTEAEGADFHRRTLNPVPNLTVSIIRSKHPECSEQATRALNNWQLLNSLYTELQQSLHPLLSGQGVAFTTGRYSSFTSQKAAHRGLSMLSHVLYSGSAEVVAYSYSLEH